MMVTSRTLKSYVEALLESNGSSRWTQNTPVPEDMSGVPAISSKEFRPESVAVIFTEIESDLAIEFVRNQQRKSGWKGFVLPVLSSIVS